MSLQEKSMYAAMELSKSKWKVAFGDGSRERFRTVEAGDVAGLLREVATAREKLGLPADAPAVFCYEAGRDGFWIQRMLTKNGFECDVMDPASIEVPRRARKRKTDRLDAQKLLKLLLRSRLWGESDAYSSVRVPSEEQEASMRLHRERERLVKERTGHRTRMHSLLALAGIVVRNPASACIDRLRDWEGKALKEAWTAELEREQSRLLQVQEQIKLIEREQESALEEGTSVAIEKARKLRRLRGLGTQSGWLLSHECFAWRTFGNRKRLGSFAGLTGTPFDSGETLREQGISKSGSGRVRRTMVELAWGWTRWQPDSALTRWFVENYARGGTKRSRRKGIVALARKLLVALWKYVEQGIVPEGAVLKA